MGWFAMEKHATCQGSPSRTYRPGGRKRAEARSVLDSAVCPVKECLAYVCRGDGKASIFQNLET